MGCSSIQGICDQLTRGFISLLYICMQGLCAQLTGGSISLYIYIYKQCSCMQGICAQLTWGVHLPSIYISSVPVCKASMLN